MPPTPAAFVGRIRTPTGLKLRVLDGEDEARLSFRSALAHFDLGAGRAVVVDIGGGSLELALSADGLVDRLVSLPFGALRLTERFLTPHTTPQGGEETARVRSQGARHPIAGARLARRPRHRLRRHVHEPRRHLPRPAGDHRRPDGARHRIPRVDLEHILDVLAGDVARGATLRCPGSTPAARTSSSRDSPSPPRCWRASRPRGSSSRAYGIREGLLLETARIMPDDRRPGRGARALGARVRRRVPLRGAALVAGAAARAAALRRARRAPRVLAGGSRHALRRRAAARRRVPHQLRPAPQAFVPPDLPRRPARHVARRAGRRRARARAIIAAPSRTASTQSSRRSTSRLRRRISRLSAHPARGRRVRPRSRRGGGPAQGPLDRARDPDHARAAQC